MEIKMSVIILIESMKSQTLKTKKLVFYGLVTILLYYIDRELFPQNGKNRQFIDSKDSTSI